MSQNHSVTKRNRRQKGKRNDTKRAAKTLAIIAEKERLEEQVPPCFVDGKFATVADIESGNPKGLGKTVVA